jgi:hypothetical protein
MVERHVQDMESALQRFVDAWFEGPDYDEPLNAAASEAMTVLGTTFALADKPGVAEIDASDKPHVAALPAREKGTEEIVYCVCGNELGSDRCCNFGDDE